MKYAGELQLLPRQLPSKSKEAEALHELAETVSASRLYLWLRCRLQFYFSYVRRIVKAPTPGLFVGKVIHGVLQQWSLARWRRDPFCIEHFRELFEEDWVERQSDMVMGWDGEEEKHRESAWTALECYFHETPIKPDERPEAVEVCVEAELPGLPRLIGIIDLVRSGGRIVDFKTAAKTPDVDQLAHQHEIQTSCYAVLYRHCTNKREQDIELHHLVKTKTPKLIVTALGPMTRQQENRLYRVIESYQEGIQRRDFVPSPGFHCSSCEYYDECRKWGGKEQDA